MKRINDLMDQAAELGVSIVHAQSASDQTRIAIHLLEPSLDELESALETAERDMFPAIVVHSKLTWPTVG
jgi:hypothetical protein